MPDQIPAEAVQAATLAVEAAIIEEFGHGGTGGFAGDAASAALEVAAPLIAERAVAEERAAILTVIRSYFAPVEGDLWGDVQTLCGRIERGNHLPAPAAEQKSTGHRVKQRIVCPVCGRDVVKRDDGKPKVHYPPAGRTELTCGGQMSDHCKGGCKCGRDHSV